MKKILLLIFVPIAFVLAIPVTLLVLMYDGSSWENFDREIYHEEADSMASFYEDLNEALATYESEAQEDEDLIIPLHQNVVNTMIFEALKGYNEDYMPNEDCDSDACQYAGVIELDESGDRVLRIKGAWVTFSESSSGNFTMNVAVEAGNRGGFMYKTTLQLRFSLEDRDDEYYVAFDRFRMGSLPLTRGMLSRTISLVDRFADIDLTEYTEDYPWLMLDESDMSLTIDKQDFANSLDDDEDDEMNALLGELLSIMFERRLLHFEVRDQMMDITFGVSLLRSADDEDIPEYLYDMHDEDGYNNELFDSASFMRARFDQYTFNRALTGDTRYHIRESHFNKKLYDNFNGFEDFRIDRRVDGRMMSVGLQGLWFDFGENDIKVNALMEMDTIKSMLDMRWEVISLEDDRIEYELTRVAVGDREGKTPEEFILINEETDPERLESFRNFFASLGDVQFAIFTEEGTLVISAETLESFMEEGTVEGNLTIDSIEIDESGIYLDLRASNPTLESVLQAFNSELLSAFESPELLGNLDEALSPEEGSPEEEVINKVQEIQDQINQDGEADPDTIEAMFDAYEQMSQENQEAFMDTIHDEMNQTIVDEFDNLF